MILNSGQDDDDAVLERREIFAARRERVFTAWTDATVLKRWWGPLGCITRSVEMDLRVGGRYCITMQFPQEAPFHIYGVYRAIQPPEKLVFTWRCDKDGLDIGDSLVTIEFFDRGNSTEVALTHERIADHKVRVYFGQGWDEEFAKLKAFLAQDLLSYKGQ